MKFHIIIIYISIIPLLSSCYCTYDITVNKNGSAHIEIYDWKEYNGETIEESFGGEEFYSGFDEFKKSRIISNYTNTVKNGFYRITYDIETIDSLNHYLLPPEVGKDYEQSTFKYTNNSFTINHSYEENGPSEITMYGDLIPVKLIFRFKKKIKKIKSDLNYVQQKSKKSIEINAMMNEISYGKGTHEIIVSFKK